MIAGMNFVRQEVDRDGNWAIWLGAVLLALMPCIAGMLAGAGPADASVPGASVLGAALVLTGLLTLRLCDRRLGPHLAMLLLCSVAMIVGLLIDLRSLTPLDLARHCRAGSLDFWRNVTAHWALVPFMQTGMVLAALTCALTSARAGWRRGALDLGRGLVMLAGADIGAWAVAWLPDWGVDGLMALMWGAMVWGAVLVPLLCRLSLSVARRPRPKPWSAGRWASIGGRGF